MVAGELIDGKGETKELNVDRRSVVGSFERSRRVSQARRGKGEMQIKKVGWIIGK